MGCEDDRFRSDVEQYHKTYSHVNSRIYYLNRLLACFFSPLFAGGQQVDVTMTTTTTTVHETRPAVEEEEAEG